jgi:acetylornithine deacetylase
MAHDMIFSDLTELIAFPTVSDRPNDELAAFLATRLEDSGFTVESFPDPGPTGKRSLVARCGPDAPGGITLSGHMDVVPTEGQPWTSDPFRLTERDGKLFGRGTADMKGFFAATLAALRALRSTRLQRPLAIVFTHDEEIGCLGSAQIAASWSDRRPLPPACLIGEPTNFRMLRMHPGHVAAELCCLGRAAHSSRPDLGENAIETAADAMVLLRHVRSALEQEFATHLPYPPGVPRLPLNVARIRGGTAVNIVPDSCTVDLGFRPPPGVPGDVLLGKLADALRQHHPGLHLRKLRETPSLLTEANTPLEGWLQLHAELSPSPMATFATDGGNLARLGLQPIIFGPGSIDVAHQADEYVESSALVRAVSVLEHVIHEACVRPVPV